MRTLICDLCREEVPELLEIMEAYRLADLEIKELCKGCANDFDKELMSIRAFHNEQVIRDARDWLQGQQVGKNVKGRKWYNG